MIAPFSSPFRSPFQPPGADRYGGLTIPRTMLIWYAPNGVDTIRLPAAALWAALPEAHRSIYFSDPDDSGSMLDDATIISNMEASPYYNNGEELVGIATRRAQYGDGTSETVLRKAYRYLGVAWPEAIFIVDGFDFITDGADYIIDGA